MTATKVTKAEAGRSFGIVGGLGPLAGADVLFKLLKALHADSRAGPCDVIFEQHPFRDPTHSRTATVEQKLYIFDMIRDFERRGVRTVVLPCFLSHTFIDQLQENASLKVVDMIDALVVHVRRCYPSARRIGVLTSDYMREEKCFERYFQAPEFEVLHPRALGGTDCVTTAVYGDEGIRNGNLEGRAVELIREACIDLLAQGAEVILPGLTEVALVSGQIALSVPVTDSNLVYAEHVATGQYADRARPFKVGVVGGVGPAATVDFVQKIVRSTPASRDQDHIKLVIEQNPQIPDRTSNLVGNGPDPTVALYATCKKLEAGDADLIAIPCNTAHAFVERIQPYLNVPILNMLTVTVDHLRRAFPALREVGLLATSGTIESGVYRKALASHGLKQTTPGNGLQARLMNAIYGPRGVKAGFTKGECVEDIHAALNDLIDRDIEVVILGCTELPLLLPQASFTSHNGRVMRLVDPTEILAKRCVAYARREATVGTVGRMTKIDA
ncbi:aspartate/glutamate racemase family protein [Paraburkholderia sp.]|jgi:aspartate racemase|uniref:aspartate/glutamate racemase family protein n=1 Tax=Paraburkholderia sp. TaxID=1926495 RepID=UPI003C34A365